MIAIYPPVRREDKHGKGYYLAPRTYGKHRGIDFNCVKGSKIATPNSGEVTKIGYPYDPRDKDKSHLRYVQITERGKYRCRYFYVSPLLSLGTTVNPGDIIGITQGLLKVYPGINDHFHYEVIEGTDNYLDPQKYLKGEVS